MPQFSYIYFVYRNRGSKVLQMVEREGIRNEDGTISYVNASAKIPKNFKTDWDPSDWTIKTSNVLRNDEKGLDAMVASFAPFVLVNELTGDHIRLCENKITTALPPRGECEIPVTTEMMEIIQSWIKDPVSISHKD
jgi:hypothetical protein